MSDGLNPVLIVPVLIIFFGITIFVHEFGHYLAARLCGLVVQVFSIGFGPAIWKKKHNGITYKIGWIPFGGYVALPQLDPTSMATIQGENKEDGAGAPRPEAASAPKEEEEERQTYPPISPWKKIVVSVAGPFGNMVLAVGIAWLVYWIGMPAGPSEKSALVGYVDRDSAAYAQGMRLGDEILSVNGTEVKNWREFQERSALQSSVTLGVRTAEGQTRTVELATEKGDFGEYTVRGLDGLGLCVVAMVEKDMPAEKAGLTAGDRIVEFNGKPVLSRPHFAEMLNDVKNIASPLKVTRVVDGQLAIVNLTVVPAFDEKTQRVRIGIGWLLPAVEYDTIVKPRPSVQLKEQASLIFRILKALVTPKQAKAAQSQMGGPVMIVIGYWYMLKTSLMLAVWFTGFLNVNLAILNLLPIPVLDGGHILFSLWEVITRRRVPPKVVEALVQVFAVLLIGVFVLITLRDIDRTTPAGRYLRALFRDTPPKGAVTNGTGKADVPAEGSVTNPAGTVPEPAGGSVTNAR